ncbi:prolyl-tRNA synthetase [Catenuloplanes nepalensis]|uniref:Proline--tRNA ligase n=1 Tax=Catenuloplanes nepalensis TaxID=587533 RepID=A0ABT9N477_9ACTN|nr:proline--tRNA ligase [Catenuloplanes nepalensis]MDP9798476.1 prolyl-tRNA synthetase [Catenuloplanes nepalensis]
MLLRMSTLFLRTLREDPAEAEVPSHRLLVRAGYVRRAAPGGYTWLPLGKMVLDRVAAIVHEEMRAIGGQEVHFPALLPREAYERSGRWTAYGDDIFRLKDRRGAEYLLAPTHEEMFTLLVQDLFGSYRDFPVILYQIQTKFRDEARPRAGLLRGREFLMKDAYSFDLTDSGLEESYAKHRVAYQRIFERLGLDFTIVSAQSGAMGGSGSEEFLAAAEVGEDTFVGCTACSYAANTEAVTTPAVAAGSVEHPAAEVHDTPETPTIQSLVDLANARGLAGRTDWTAADTLKNVVVELSRPGVAEKELLVIGVPGDREVDLKRVEAQLHPAAVAMFDDFAARPDLVRGYIGPQKLDARYLVDPRVTAGSAWLTGANEPGRHATNVVSGRDFTPDGTIEAVEVRAGDPCPNCADGTLEIRRGMEIGHIFQLGRRFADAFGLDALGQDGKPIRITMGSYGVGVSRAVAAIAEQHCDERGLVWPKSVAPFDVQVIPAGKGAQLEIATELASTLVAAGLRVLLDDRPAKVSTGVRFADADLIGAPHSVVVGRGAADGVVELRVRATDERSEVAISDVVGLLTRD